VMVILCVGSIKHIIQNTNILYGYQANRGSEMDRPLYIRTSPRIPTPASEGQMIE
jgi:hypothetical protein